MRGLLDWAQKNKSRLLQQKVGSSKGTQTAARWCRRPSCCRRGRSPPPSLTRMWRSTPPSRQQRCCCANRTRDLPLILADCTWGCILSSLICIHGSWYFWRSRTREEGRFQRGRRQLESCSGWSECRRIGSCTAGDTPLQLRHCDATPEGCSLLASRTRETECIRLPENWTRELTSKTIYASFSEIISWWLDRHLSFDVKCSLSAVGGLNVLGHSTTHAKKMWLKVQHHIDSNPLHPLTVFRENN